MLACWFEIPNGWLTDGSVSKEDAIAEVLAEQADHSVVQQRIKQRKGYAWSGSGGGEVILVRSAFEEEEFDGNGDSLEPCPGETRQRATARTQH